MWPGGLVRELKFPVRSYDCVLPCLSLRRPPVPHAYGSDGGCERDHGCLREPPPAVPSDSRPWGAPQEEVHTAFKLCLREEWQVLGSALDDPAGQHGLSPPLHPYSQPGRDPSSFGLAIIEADPVRLADVDLVYAGGLPTPKAVADTEDGEGEDGKVGLKAYSRGRAYPKFPETYWPGSELYTRPAQAAMARWMGPTVGRSSWSFSAMRTTDMVPRKAAEDFLVAASCTKCRARASARDCSAYRSL